MHNDALKPNATASRLKRLVGTLLPASVVEHLRELRELSGPERRAHLRNTLRRVAGRKPAVPKTLRPSDTVVFVCHGNIIRSALAAGLMQRHAAELGLPVDGVISAGVAARPGREADPRAVAAGHALGVDLRTHRAQPLTNEILDAAAVVYVMDRLNEAKLLARFPSAHTKLCRLGALAEAEGDDVIADPYVLDAAAVAAVASRIDRATRALALELARRSGTTAGSAR